MSMLLTAKDAASLIGVSDEGFKALRGRFPQILKRLTVGRGMYRRTDIEKLIAALAGESPAR